MFWTSAGSGNWKLRTRIAAWRMGTWIARGGVLFRPIDATSMGKGRSRARFQPVMIGSVVKAKSVETTSGAGGGCQ